MLSSHWQIHGMAKLMWDLNWNVMEEGKEGKAESGSQVGYADTGCL